MKSQNFPKSKSVLQMYPLHLIWAPIAEI